MPEVDWTRAKCRSVDPEVMFPPTGRAHKKIRNAAKAICRGHDGRNECPVRTACRDWAVETADYGNGGIWGGLSDRERKRFVATGHDASLIVVRADLVLGRPVAKDDGLPRAKEAGHRPRRTNRANAAGAGGRQRRASTAGRAARQRTGEVVVLPTRRLPTNHGCDTARGVGEDAVAGDLRGRARRPRKVAAVDQASRAAVRAVAVRRLRDIVDGDIA